MHIQYQTVTLEGVRKSADIMFGIYELEAAENAPFKRWVWTSNIFGGTLNGIDAIDFRFKSPIDNLLVVNDKMKFFLKKDILSNLRIPTKDFIELKMKLDDTYHSPNDPRDLGLLLFGINIGSSELF